MRFIICFILTFPFFLSSCKKPKTEYEVRVEFKHEGTSSRISSSTVYLNDLKRNPNSGSYTHIFDAKAGDELDFGLRAYCDVVNGTVFCNWYISVDIYIDDELYKNYRKKDCCIDGNIILPSL